MLHYIMWYMYRWEYRNTLSDTYTRRRTKTKQVEYSPLDCEGKCLFYSTNLVC